MVTTVGDRFLCLGGEDGAVRFYDPQFRLEAWFEDLEAGAVTSVGAAAREGGGRGEGARLAARPGAAAWARGCPADAARIGSSAGARPWRRAS